MLKTTIQITFMFLLVLGLAACATSQVSGPLPVSNDSNSGIVVLSVTHTEDVGTVAKALFYMDHKVSLIKQRLLYSTQEILGVATKGDFDGFEGVVYVLKLEPGTHAIDGWTAEQPPAYVTPRTPPKPLTFEVNPGEVIYLGNLHMNISLSETWLGRKAIRGGFPEVRNQFDRDIQVAERKVPGISQKVSVRLLPIGPWTTESDSVRGVDMPPVIPVPAKR